MRVGAPAAAGAAAGRDLNTLNRAGGVDMLVVTAECETRAEHSEKRAGVGIVLPNLNSCMKCNEQT